MNYEDFRNKIKKINDTRVHKVTNSLGVYDAYKYIRKNKWFNIGRPLKEGEFYRIIRLINLKLADYLVIGAEIKLPHRLGSLELRKRPNRVAIVNGEFVNNFPIDWDATLNLWYKDEEAYNNKTVVRTEDKDLYMVYYNKTKAEYVNKSFYLFKANRELKKRIIRAARNGVLEAYKFAKYD